MLLPSSLCKVGRYSYGEARALCGVKGREEAVLRDYEIRFFAPAQAIENIVPGLAGKSFLFHR